MFKEMRKPVFIVSVQQRQCVKTKSVQQPNSEQVKKSAVNQYRSQNKLSVICNN